jgi:hypothetical protein
MTAAAISRSFFISALMTFGAMLNRIALSAGTNFAHSSNGIICKQQQLSCCASLFYTSAGAEAYRLTRSIVPLGRCEFVSNLL